MTESATVRRVLITGARGQLGTELQKQAPAGTELIATGIGELDITRRSDVLAFVEGMRPSLIVNAAAYTAVDKAEDEPDLAFRINRDGAANLAEAAKKCGARIIHVSTDYVFDGTKCTPYEPSDAPNPINVYGLSKLEGERAVIDRAGELALVLRTAWIYSSVGQNFVKTMVRLFRERDEVRVVSDQVGTPTCAGSLADGIWTLSQRPSALGLLHFTDAGVASWYDFAVSIAEMCGEQGMPFRLKRVLPISTADFPTRARRPAFSVLGKSATWSICGVSPHWRNALRTFFSTAWDQK